MLPVLGFLMKHFRLCVHLNFLFDFFIDDIHVWEVNYNVIPTVQNLNIYSEDSQVSLTWDMPPSESYDNDEVANDDGSPENSWAWGVEPVKYGSVFDMPYGTESVVVHSASFLARAWLRIPSKGCRMGSPVARRRSVAPRLWKHRPCQQ